MENLRSLEPQAKISHSYKKKDCITQYVFDLSSQLDLDSGLFSHILF